MIKGSADRNYVYAANKGIGINSTTASGTYTEQIGPLPRNYVYDNVLIERASGSLVELYTKYSFNVTYKYNADTRTVETMQITPVLYTLWGGEYDTYTGATQTFSNIHVLIG